MSVTALAAVLATLMPVGGAIGYLRKGSVVSFVAGTGVGSLYAWAWYVLSVTRPGTEDYQKGLSIGSATSLLLFIAMFVRWIKTRKPLPLGVSVIGGIAACLFSIQMLL